MKIPNYFDLLINSTIDNKTCSPICIDGVADILQEIYLDLKKAMPIGKFQKTMKENSLLNILQWKNNWYPIPLYKIKQLLSLWKITAYKSNAEYDALYEKIYNTAIHFRAIKSPVKVKVVREITPDLAYLLGIIYADGSLRNIDLTFNQEGRYRWEINITDETTENLSSITSLLDNIFGIKTGVKKVYDGQWHRILFQSMILWRILHTVFEMPQGYKKGRLTMPHLVKKSPFEIKRHFVIGFFDGDGWCNKNENSKYPAVSLSQSSPEILDEINLVLREAGLQFRTYKKNSNNYDYYVLETKDKKQIQRFQEIFGFRSIKKKERLQKLIQNF